MLTVLGPVLQNPISGLLHEMESILAEQKTVSCRNDKSKWWEGRKALDSRVEVSCKQQTSPLQSSHCRTNEKRLEGHDHFMTENFLFRNCLETWRPCWEAGEAFFYHLHQIQRFPGRLSSSAGPCQLKASQSARTC